MRRNFYNPRLHPATDSLQRLCKQVQSEAANLIKANVQRIASVAASLLKQIRQSHWSAATLLCAALYQLIQIQIEAERIRARYRRKGGCRYGRRH